MTHKKQKKNPNFKVEVIQAKITPATAARIDKVVKKFGFSSRYEILQYLVSAFLHYADPEGETTPVSSELEQVGMIFQGCESPTTRLNTMRMDESNLIVTDDIRLMQMPGSDTYLSKWIHHDKYGDKETGSAPAVLKLILSRLLPDRYDYLMRVANELDSTSVLRALDYLIDSDRSYGTPDAAEYASNTYGIVPVRKFKKEIK